MNIKRLGVLLSASLFLFLFSCKEHQEKAKLCINEVLIDNVNNCQDDYGVHSAWIEIFNNSFGSVDIASYRLYVKTEGIGETVYVIPKGDVSTVIKPRQHVLFWADGEPSKGTFHTNIKLYTDRTMWIEIHDSGGKMVGEGLRLVPNTIKANESFGRVEDGSPVWEVKDGSQNRYVTPSTNNRANVGNSKMAKFQQDDSLGIGMSITAMSVVFSSLILLYLSFRFIGKLSVYLSKRNKEKAEAKEAMSKLGNKSLKDNKQSKDGDEDVYVAIAMAIHMFHDEAHDEESMVLTLDQESQSKSAWRSKAGTLRELPQRKK